MPRKWNTRIDGRRRSPYCLSTCAHYQVEPDGDDCSIHSFRGGTGKSNTAANLATVVADAGQRVGVIDTDIQSPGIRVLFGLAS